MFRRRVGTEKRPAEVIIRQPETHGDPIKRGLKNQRVSPGPTRLRRPIKIRRSLPIRAYVGPNGHGKSTCAVLDLMPSLERGRYVLSTAPLLDWRAKPDPDVFALDTDLGLWLHRESGARWQRPTHPYYIRLTEWSQLVEAEHCDVLLDDVAGVASSRQSSGMPAAIEKLLQKLRHADITLAWTAPAWARADLVIRETTQAVTVAEGSRPERTESSDRLWLRNRLFEWTTYDAKLYTDWTEGKRDKAKRLTFQRFYGPGSDVFNAYDSLGGVDTITSVTDAGRCVGCGGTRRAPACTCADYVARMDEARERGSAASAAPRGASSRAGSTRSRNGHDHDGSLVSR
jgi:hypothetical protein